VAIVQTLEPDIVFLDISMPEMDGVKSWRRCSRGRAHIVFVDRLTTSTAIRAFDRRAPSIICLSRWSLNASR
jgi:chemotaxis response regulator CheB